MPSSQFPGLVAHLMRIGHRARSAQANPHGLEPGTPYLLSHLISHGDLRAAQLADLVGVDASLISRQVHQLIDEGFIARIADPADGRASLLHITEVGREFFKNHHDKKCAFFNRVMQNWPAAEEAEFERLLAQFVQDLDQEFHNIQQNQEGHSHHE